MTDSQIEELRMKCKALGLSQTGGKNELAGRLDDFLAVESEEERDRPKTSTPIRRRAAPRRGSFVLEKKESSILEGLPPKAPRSSSKMTTPGRNFTSDGEISSRPSSCSKRRSVNNLGFIPLRYDLLQQDSSDSEGAVLQDISNRMPMSDRVETNSAKQFKLIQTHNNSALASSDTENMIPSRPLGALRKRTNSDDSWIPSSRRPSAFWSRHEGIQKKEETSRQEARRDTPNEKVEFGQTSSLRFLRVALLEKFSSPFSTVNEDEQFVVWSCQTSTKPNLARLSQVMNSPDAIIEASITGQSAARQFTVNHFFGILERLGCTPTMSIDAPRRSRALILNAKLSPNEYFSLGCVSRRTFFSSSRNFSPSPPPRSSSPVTPSPKTLRMGSGSLARTRIDDSEYREILVQRYSTSPHLEHLAEGSDNQQTLYAVFIDHSFMDSTERVFVEGIFHSKSEANRAVIDTFLALSSSRRVLPGQSFEQCHEGLLRLVSPSLSAGDGPELHFQVRACVQRELLAGFADHNSNSFRPLSANQL